MSVRRAGPLILVILAALIGIRTLAQGRPPTFKATQGGRDNLYPEFMETIKQQAEEEAEAKRVANTTAAKKPPIRRR